MNYSEKEAPKIDLIKTDRIRALFQNQASVDHALSELSIHGYSHSEIVVKTQQEIAKRRFFISEPVEESDAIFFQKSIKGVKFGAIAGSLILMLVILFFIQPFNQMLQTGFLGSITFGLVVGAAWGGTLGFILAPQFPFSQLKKYELILSKGQTLLSFQPKSLKDEYFFKSLNWPTYTLTS